MTKLRKFCNNQMEAKEDKGENTYTCLAHLAEARAFPCPYTESNIKAMDRFGDGKYKFTIPTGHPGGICTDFEILPDVKKDLIAKLPKDLASKVVE